MINPYASFEVTAGRGELKKELRQEAIKWFKDATETMEHDSEVNGCLGIRAFIREFFNLKDEDLKWN